jgi:hypothetical protein
MDVGVAFCTECDQVFFGVVARVGAKLFVMDFRVCHRAARLTPPRLNTFPVLECHQGMNSLMLPCYFPVRFLPFAADSAAKCATWRAAVRRSRAKEIANSLYFSLLAGNSRWLCRQLCLILGEC